jgi:hypothetical protein
LELQAGATTLGFGKFIDISAIVLLVILPFFLGMAISKVT